MRTTTSKLEDLTPGWDDFKGHIWDGDIDPAKCWREMFAEWLKQRGLELRGEEVWGPVTLARRAGWYAEFEEEYHCRNWAQKPQDVAITHWHYERELL